MDKNYLEKIVKKCLARPTQWHCNKERPKTLPLSLPNDHDHHESVRDSLSVTVCDSR